MSGSRRAPRDLLSHWGEVAPLVRESARVALFLDFDGTLVPIAPRPEQVRLEPETRRVLGRLAKHSRVLVAVISGRRRQELLEHIALRDVRCMGLYGWERSRRSVLSAASRIALRRARAVLDENLAEFPGVWVEDKHSSFSIHVSAARPGVKRKARERIPLLLRPFRQRLRMLGNIRDLEVVPLCIPDKGTALRDCLAGEFRRALPVYFGDDYSDEPAFAAAKDGVSVIVGNRRPTRARFRLRGPDEVADALTRLEAALN